MLSEKGIESIGYNIPRNFLNIIKLYLSNNKILKLNGIENFTNLTNFSISYNYIEDFNELIKISNPSQIQSLSVKGNLFNKNPQANVLIINCFKKYKI